MLTDLLSAADKKLFYDYTGHYMCKKNDEVGPRAPVEKLLTVWAQNKEQYLFNIMQHQFTLSRDILIEKDHDTLKYEISYYLNNMTNFADKFYEFACRIYSNHNTVMAVYELINESYLADNKYSNPDCPITLSFPDGKEYKLVKGCKPIRAIKKIYKAFKDQATFSEEELDAFVLYHSQVLNEKKFSGKLTLSIHPMDFVTASDNSLSWRSCMAWKGEGEYHRGTIEMMNSPMVVCAYLESDIPFYPIPEDERQWTNKKWREFFIVTPELISGIKGYPYWNRLLEKEVLNWLRILTEVTPGFLAGDFIDHIVEFRPDYCNGIIDQDLDHYVQLCFSTEDGAMYNDFYGDYFYNMYITKNIASQSIEYNDMATCMWCGKNGYNDLFNDFDDPEKDYCDMNSTICFSCQYHPPVCAHCGHTLYDDEEIHYDEDGNVVCESCWDSKIQSPLTGKFYFCDDYCKLKKIYLYSSSQKNILGMIYIENDLTLINKLKEPLYQGEFCLQGLGGYGYWQTCIVIDYDNIISEKKREKFRSMFSVNCNNYIVLEIKYLKIMDKYGRLQTVDDFIAC